MRTKPVFGFAVVLSFVALPACRVNLDVETKTEFVDADRPVRTAEKEWNGELIEIRNDGTNPALGDTGVEVIGDPGATTVTARAVVSAQAFKEDEALAQESIREVKDSFRIVEEDGRFFIVCAHGRGRGSVEAASTGCKKLTVTVPAGSIDQPVDLRVGSGIGGIKVSGVTGGIHADSNAVGDVDISIAPTEGKSVIVTGETRVVVRLPADFSAEQVILNVDGNAELVTDDFPGMASGQSYPTQGATEGAAALLNVESKGRLSSYGVTISRQ
jgi:hypothetical protein